MNIEIYDYFKLKIFPSTSAKKRAKNRFNEKNCNCISNRKWKFWPVGRGLHQIELKARCFVIYVGRGEAVWFIFAFFAIFASRSDDGLFASQSRSLSLHPSGLHLRVDLSLNGQLMIHIIFYLHVESILISFPTIQKMVSRVSSLDS